MQRVQKRQQYQILSPRITKEDLHLQQVRSLTKTIWGLYQGCLVDRGQELQQPLSVVDGRVQLGTGMQPNPVQVLTSQ